MAKCDRCGKETDIPFDCSYCGGSFCSDHRLPPSHKCINEEKWRGRTVHEVSPTNESPSLPLTECSFPGCGITTSKTFYCPLCGHDFCEKHKFHRDHSGESSHPAGHPESGNAHQAVPQSKNPVGWYGVALIVMALIIMGGVFVIYSKISHAGPGITNLPVTAGYGTERTVGTPVPTLSPGATQSVTLSSPPATTATVTAAKTSAAKTPGIRPATGTIISGTALSGGLGTMTIDNTGQSSDVVAILTYSTSKKPLVAVYIQAGASTTLNTIPDGSYALYVNSGENWDPGTKRFIDNPDYWKFEDPITFLTSQRRSGSTFTTVYTAYTVKINPSIYGNAKSEPVSAVNFPALQ